MTEIAEIGKMIAVPSAVNQPPAQIRSYRFGLGVTLVPLLVAACFWIYRMVEDRTPPELFREMQIRRLTSSGRAFEAAISPDGRFVGYILSSSVFGGYHSLWIKQLTTNQETQLHPEAGLRYRGLAFSPDGNFLYYSQRHGQETRHVLYRIPILGGEPQKLLAGVDSAVSFSPDGSQLAFVREDEVAGESALMISNADGTAEKKVAVCKSPESFSVDGPSWSADGRLIAVAKMILQPSFHFRLTTIRVTDGLEQPLGETKWAWLMRVAWLKDESGLAAVGRIKFSCVFRSKVSSDFGGR